MQQLEERNTYTPTDIPHVSGNCDLLLKREETLSVIGLKTSSNNSDAALIATEHAKQSQLKYATGETKQPIILGVDSGFLNVGLSATTDKKEVYSAEVKLRSDMVKLNSERRQYRRARHSIKTWYRPPRFLNRKKPEGWLAPSIQHKLESHIKLIDNIKRLLPITKIIIEVAAFDIQKIKNPEISGTGYQNGVQKDSWNVREYVLHRDNHTCQACKGKSKDPILETHHIISRQIGGDAPDNLLTLCETCHEKVTKGKLKLDIKVPAGFKPETFMSIVRWKMVTTQHRSSLNFLIQQVRKCNRKLFKGDRSHIKNTAPRFILRFQRFDKVLWNNIECFVFGRRKTGYFELRKLDGTKIHASAKAKELTLLETANTFLIETLKRGTLLHTLKSVVSATPAPHGVL